MFPMVMLVTIMFMVIMMMSIISKKTKFRMTTSMPFECGFQSKKKIVPFSIQFFLLTLMFLIFDIELSFMLASVKTMNYPTSHSSTILLMFMMTMWVSLTYEMMKNSMQWVK